jgi:hypothetical protein
MRTSSIARTLTTAAVVATVVAGCSLELLEPEDVEFSDVPSPEGLMGFVADLEVAREGNVAIVWTVWEANGIEGFNVHRSDGLGPYQKINDELVTDFWYLDTHVDVPSDDHHVYVVTSVDENGRKTDPSDGVVVPAGLAVETVDGLSPGGDETDVSLEPTFTWNAVDGARSYCLFLAKSGEEDEPEWVYRDSTTSIPFAAAGGITYVWPTSMQLEYGTHYTWTVRALGEGNFTFGEGETGFTTEIADTVPPAPPSTIQARIVSYDRGGRPSSVRLRWYVEEPDRVFGCNVYRRVGAGDFEMINGSVVTQAENGSWAYADDLPYEPTEEQVYYTTAVGLGGESDASPHAIVPVDASWEHIDMLSPPNGEVGVPLLPTFSWNTVPGAETYTVVLFEGELGSSDPRWIYRDFGTSFECGQTGGVTYIPLEDGTLHCEAYHSWQVLGVNADNFVFAGGDGSSFTTEGAMSPPAPTDVLGFIYDYEGIGVERMGIFGLMDEPSALAGGNVYRKIGDGPFEKLYDEPVQIGEAGFFMAIDWDVEGPPAEEHTYYVTAVALTGAESEPSEMIVVSPGTAWEDIMGADPSETGTSVSPTFRWDPCSCADSYFLALFESSGTAELVWLYRSTGTSVECGETTGATYVPLDGGALLPGTDYEWRVVGINSDNMACGDEVSAFWTEP